MEFSIIRGLLALLLLSVAWVDTLRSSTNCGRSLCPEEERTNKVAMNTVTAELVAVEIVIVLGAVILLGTITVAWAMFWPSAHL